MRKFGIAMGGNEEPLENLIKQHISIQMRGAIYTAIEIGSAGCVSLRAFKDIISENTDKWRVHGFDLVDGWSLDFNKINEVFDGKPNILKVEDIAKDTDINTMYLWLLDDPRSYIKNFPHKVNFAFIDGCHGANCVCKDFEALENSVDIGGIVVFHDAGKSETGQDWQHHCKEFINVRSGLMRLGLLDQTRKGWRIIGETNGSRNYGGDGNSCFITQKIE